MRILKALSALCLIAAGLPLLIGGLVIMSDDIASGLAMTAAGAAIMLIAHRVSRSAGFHSRIEEIRDSWSTGETGHYALPATLEADVSLMKYRRTGSFALPMLRWRSRSIAGFSAQYNVGKLSAPRDWVEDERGRLTLTESHMIYMGARSNKKVTWRSIVNLAVDQGVLQIQQSNRGAVRFHGRGIDEEFCAAASILWQAAG